MSISSETIRSVTSSLYEWSLKKVPDDTKRVLAQAQQRETVQLGKQTLRIMLESAEAAETESHLVCSDVGVPTYMIRVGTGVSFEGNVRQAIVDGFADLVARADPPILKMVTNPLTLQRSYEGKNMPLVTFDMIDGADYMEIVCAPKAMGTGRWEAIETFVYPSLETIEKYVLDTVLKAGSQPCPPIVVGVGIGGTFDYAAKMAKECVLRPFGQTNPEPILAAMEQRLLKAINDTGFGPMGTGGDTTAMAVHIDYSASHGFMPVAVAFNCWINRRTCARIYQDGTVERLE
ncbi:fumarate hydratase [Pigmentiphaga sp.]|uniref:fumarate hydratase n=1 Tax=Pigmentiphaga sp. TaxID=1977564 RepID=UPI00128CFBDC|nr:fumarate hydratase [Pigmentiphaga sp.]MPS25208.1 fumarate hydratase [Alcaligenaceae bacterium SAGV5]MPS53868.1 fumarate hydratase [Alcaligenaceae bacterium SAGV3]MPT56219.1 fumarate hydratase [Alcaligenaceae bacterium]